MKNWKLISCIFFVVILFAGCVKDKPVDEETKMLKEKIDQYAQTVIKFDENLLDANQKIVVQKLYLAAKVFDEIFLDQVYAGNAELKAKLAKGETEKEKLLAKYFEINFGPFDRLDADKPFIGTKEKPAGANYYPEDMTKEEFEKWIQEHPEDEAAFTSEFTKIIRDGDKLVAVPYTEVYKDKLSEVTKLMREAAEYADNLTLKNYLLTRAKAFETNDYYESDMAWMDLKDHRIEVVIGPYEVYEDAIFNFKAAFECFLTIVDPAESQKLDKFASYLTDIEKNLPIEEKYKNYNRGAESPIIVAQEVFSAGDTKAGVQTLAFNLPNDERVRQAKGSKKVMLKNVHEAKFEKLLYPIAQKVLDPEQLQYVTFDGFFNHTLMHEISHGVGPGFIKINGRETEVKKELKETYSKLEECKADLLGMYTDIFMIEKGVYPKEFEKEIWGTFLAGIFRSVRFGVDAAHGAGNAIIFNYVLEKGGYEFDESTQRVKVNFDKVYDAVKDLAHKVLMIQALGDYEASKELIAAYGIESPTIKILREKLVDLPIDIWPIFQIEQ